MVTLTATGYGRLGQVVEILPAGFTYVSSPVPGDSVDLSNDGRSLTFTLLGEEPFTYTVTTPSTEGDYLFSGVLTDEDRTMNDVGGDTSVTVESSGPPPQVPSGTRSLSPAAVNGGDAVIVTLTATGYGRFGSVVETLPAGFVYVSSSVPDDTVNLSNDGQMVMFALLGEETLYLHRYRLRRGWPLFLHRRLEG